MLFLTFFGAARSEQAEHAHESSPLLWIPLAILAIGVAFAGVLELSPDGRLAAYLEPVTGVLSEGSGLPFADARGHRGRGGGGGARDRLVDLRLGPGRPAAFRERMEPMATAAQHGWYVDRAYDVVFIQPAKALARMTATSSTRRSSTAPSTASRGWSSGAARAAG